MFCIRKRIVILYRLSAGSKEIPFPTSMFGIFRILFKSSSEGSSTLANESTNDENDLAGFSCACKPRLITSKLNTIRIFLIFMKLNFVQR